MKIPLIIIGATVAVVLIAASTTYFILGNLTPPEPPPVVTPVEKSPPSEETIQPPEETAPPPEAPPPTVEEKVETFIQAIVEVSTTGESQEVTLTFTEAEVNEQAAELLTQVEMPEDIPMEIKEVRVDLQTGNNLATEAEVFAYGIGVILQVKTQVSVREGKPDVAVTDVSFGNPFLDAILKDRVTELITQKMDDLLIKLTETAIGGGGEIDLEFKAIDIQEEEMTVTVMIKPET
ncbi:hypothetical protein ACFLXJ_03405 [Chloroflexota bacterium]